VGEDLRDRLWKSAYYLWYNSSYNAELASRMVDRLKTIDDVTKVLVALTASGSAVAGWNLWSKSGFDLGWAALAGTGAVLAIVHGSLGIPARLKDWLEAKKDFLGLRSTVDALRSKMTNHPDFDPAEIEKLIADSAARFGEYEGRIPSDFFATARLKSQCQENIDHLLVPEQAQLPTQA
jgi:hypothetical protein